jgi:hypothetical protein
MPITLKPSLVARMVMARIAGFNPGTSPPPVKIAIVFEACCFRIIVAKFDLLLQDII